ncbi:hypothetical protein [Oceanivirga salmonicida]|uniref:hypothetical protein n=1 Tax=Oceanivirga salmonicida TaxID=1769291 RepID=UPI0012E271CE|nr:hypothetical protein [Oceanivirga salmonicida]
MRKKIWNDEDLKYQIEIATQTLDRNINFIMSCDNKASILITFIGIVLTITLTSDIIIKIKKMIIGISGCKIIYLVSLFISGILICCGIYNTISVLVARVAVCEENKSKLFFRDIGKYISSDKYVNDFIHFEKEEILEDLINQIYVNSKISIEKYKKYNKGLKCTISGLMIFIVIIIISNIQ